MKQKDEWRVGERAPVDLGCHIEKMQSMCQEGLECLAGLGGASQEAAWLEASGAKRIK